MIFCFLGLTERKKWLSIRTTKLSSKEGIMHVLSKVVRNGHFVWCPVERTLAQGSCQRCKGTAYLFAMLFSGATAVLEFWGSSETRSLSLGSDAWHVVFDSLGYLIGAADALLVGYLVHDRATVASIKRGLEVTVGIFISLAALLILYESLGRLWASHVPEIQQAGLLFFVATAGLVVNVALLFLFQRFAIGHSHGGASHEHQVPRDRILEANVWHTLGDAVSSALVIANAVIFSFTSEPSLRYLDLVVSAVIATLILYQGVRMILSRH